MIHLEEREWLPRRAAHERRVDSWTRHRLQRRRLGQEHPVDDFLFTYYSTRPGRLRVWHPGLGVQLSGGAAAEYLQIKGYRRTPGGVTADPSMFASRAESARWIQGLVAETLHREPSFGCFGMHEWAMVYRSDEDDIRHPTWPLRLPAGAIAEVVEEQGLRCTHFDAFRFFTAEAAPLNALPLTRVGQRAFEQPGCLHANMDLYKWSRKLSPLTSSDLVADSFELARDIRTLDMQASPYDLTELGFPPVCVETVQGQAEYVVAQRAFTVRAQELRRRLLSELDSIVPNLVATTA